jgi:plasmid stabilization system protein ParE
MKVECSDAALADLDRFATFLRQQRPSLAGIVAEEIIKRVELLADHPMLGPL